MDRRNLLLAALATADRASFSPVQVQKLMFLIDRRLAESVGGPHFNFKPYDYGPFDRAVYDELENLARETDSVEITRDRSWRTYRLTEAGEAAGRQVLGELEPHARDFIERASAFVRQLSFSELVSAIYRTFPEMRAKSVFRDPS